MDELIFSNHKFRKEREYWLEKLYSLSGHVYIQPDKDQDKCKRLKKKQMEFLIDRGLYDKLNKLGKGSNLSLYLILQTAFKILMYKYSGLTDLVVASPSYQAADGANNIILLRDEVDDELTFRDFLLQVRKTTLEGYENQAYPLNDVIQDLRKRSQTSLGDLFQITCLMENLHLCPLAGHHSSDLTISFYNDGHVIQGKIDYPSSFFQEESVEWLIKRYLYLLEQVLEDSQCQLKKIDIALKEEKERIFSEFNTFVFDYPQEKTISEKFAEQVNRVPEKVAVVDEVQQLTYTELDRKVNQVAHYLRKLGVSRDTRVGIMAERSVEVILGIFAIIKAGGCYVPIDPEYPLSRKQFILEDSQIKVLLTTQQSLERDQEEKDLFNGLEVLTIDAEDLFGHEPIECEPINMSDDLAYIIYTSGTSGQPKGVMITHGNVQNLVLGLHQRVYQRYKEDLNICLISPIIFDASVKQIFAALLLGHTLYIVPEEARMDGRKLLDFYGKHQIHISDGTPIHLRLMLDRFLERDADLPIKHFLIGGEALSQKIAREFIDGFHGTPVITNVYGPTECCVDTTTFEVTKQNVDVLKRIPIGTPLPNVKVLVLDQHQIIQPIGIAGELYISGHGVARGYLNREDLTREKFLPDPFFGAERMYRTGDQVRWLPDGNIEYLGRLDQQVKIRGYRIEPDEIEQILHQYPGVQEVAVTVFEDERGEKSLCAYLLPEKETFGQIKPAGQTVSRVELPCELRDQLQTFMEHGIKNHREAVALRSQTRKMTFDVLDSLTANLGQRIDEVYDDRYVLSDGERVRYTRQMLLADWGVENQEKLKSVEVCVVGAGGIGSPIIQQLALLGIGTIHVCDYDIVDLSNLNRQILHDESRLGMNKALSAAITVARINPHVKVVVHDEKITRENIETMIGNSSLIFDCVDDLETKFVLSEFAVVKGIPHLLSAMLERSSYSAILHSPETPCFHCLYDVKKMEEVKKIKEMVPDYQKNPFPVAAPSLFVSTGFLCNEALKLLLGFEKPAFNRFFFFNQQATPEIVKSDGYKQMTYAFSDHFRTICKEQGFDWDQCWSGQYVEELELKKNPHCPICGDKAWLQRTETSKQKGHVRRIGENQVVSLLLTAETDQMVAILAALRVGKIFQILDPQGALDDVSKVLEQSRSRLIITDEHNYLYATKLQERVSKNIPILHISEFINMEETLDKIEYKSSAKEENVLERLKRLVDGQALYLNEGKKDKSQLIAEVKIYLHQRLPEYMVPTYFVVLDEFPLTHNGKLNRKQLPNPTVQLFTGMEYVAPRDQVDQKLIEIWSDILLLQDRIGITENFFEIGGNSLKATTMVSMIHKELDVEVPLLEIFRRKTVMELADFIANAEGSVFKKIKPVEARPFYPLSSAQKRMYIAHQLNPTSINYNMPTIFCLDGKLDKERVQKAFEQLVTRHEVFRTRFMEMNGEPMQWIDQDVVFTMEYVQAKEEEIDSIVQAFVQPFELRQAPLLRVTLAVISEDRHVLMTDMHHIIADGVSRGVMMQEFSQLFAGDALPELNIHYKDYAVWQQHSDQSGYETYWMQRFAGELPTLQLPLDYPRSAHLSSKGNRLNFDLPEELTLQLKELLRVKDVTLFMALLAVYTILLHKYSGQEDIIVGTVTAGRCHANLEQIIGVFLNTLALRNYPTGEKVIGEYLTEVKENTLSDFAHQEYQFEDLVERLKIKGDRSHNPLFDTMFMLQNLEVHQIELEDIVITPYDFENSLSKFDIKLMADERGGVIHFVLDYRTDLFKRSTMEQFRDHFVQLIKMIIQDPERKIAKLEFLSTQDRSTILADFNDDLVVDF